MKKSDEDLHRIASDYASTFDDVSWDCEEDFCAGFRACEKDLLPEITKLKEALREAVEIASGFARDFDFYDSAAIFEADRYHSRIKKFQSKHAAIIAEITKGEA